MLKSICKPTLTRGIYNAHIRRITGKTQAVSDLLRQKLRTYFIVIDRDHDGLICGKDFTENLAKGFETNFPKQKAVKLIEHSNELWEKLLKPMGTEVDGEIKVSLDQFDASHIQRMSSGEYRGKTMDIIKGFSQVFDSIDANNDHTVDYSEFRAYHAAHGIHPFCARSAFDALDTNGDGVISRTEWEIAYFEFFMSNQDTRSKHFFGPLLVYKNEKL